MTLNRLTFFLVNASQIWVSDMNLYNKLNDLPYLDLGRIHKDTGNRPLKLGQFFSFVNFHGFIGYSCQYINKALVRSKILAVLALALRRTFCARAHANFFQDLALSLKTFWAPLNFALILEFLEGCILL